MGKKILKDISLNILLNIKRWKLNMEFGCGESIIDLTLLS